MSEELDQLYYILSHKRPYAGKSDEKIIAEILDPIEGMKSDLFGNRYMHIGDADVATLFSCHTDTVHKNSGQQKVLHDANKGVLYKDDNHPLGADDGIGMWIMLQMIKQKHPGLYIFHRGEECGGLGSNYIATDNEFMLKPMKRAVAFDRRGTKDIITAQSGGKCASDEFALELAKQLNMGHKPARGMFTDTANYTRVIPECTNISVGYDREHTKWETQDLGYAQKLLERIFYVDWEKLPVERKPGDSGQYGWGSRDNFNYGKELAQASLSDYRASQFGFNEFDYGNSYGFTGPLEYDELYQMIMLNPEIMAQVLANKMTTESDIARAKEVLKLPSKVVNI